MSTAERRLKSCQLTGKSYMLFSCTILELKHHLREMSISRVVSHPDRHPRDAQHSSPLQTDLPATTLYCPTGHYKEWGGGQEKRTVLQTRIPPAAYEKGCFPRAGCHPLIAEVVNCIFDSRFQAKRLLQP